MTAVADIDARSRTAAFTEGKHPGMNERRVIMNAAGNTGLTRSRGLTDAEMNAVFSNPPGSPATVEWRSGQWGHTVSRSAVVE